MPVEFQILGFGVRLILLNSVADIPQNFSFCGIVDFGMILDLIDGSEAEIGRSNCLLSSSGELDDGDVESP